MQGEPFLDGLPGAIDEALHAPGFERGLARLPGLAHGLCGVDEEVAHGERPRLLVDVDERLEFAQMMGVAEGVIDVCEGGVGAEMIMHHHCAREPFRNVAARLADPVERMVLARGRVQPMQAACDPKAGFVEMADLGFSVVAGT